MKLTDWLVSKSTSPTASSPAPLPLSTSKTIPSSKENLKMPPKEKKSEGTSSGGRASTGAGASATTTTSQGLHSCKYKQDVTLPQNKIKVIMKSSPEIDQVGHDVLFLISKATELFIDHITNLTYNQAHKTKNIEYRHLADMTQKQGNLEFLRDIVPMKMLARDALKEVAKQTAQANKELLGD